MHETRTSLAAFIRPVQHFTHQALIELAAMNFSPELSVALQRVTACNNGDRLLSMVRTDLLNSLQESHDAVLHAHDAWMQLEMLGTDVMSIGGVVDLHDKDSLFKAFKESKVLTRDRVVWQAIGRFRAPLDVLLTTNYLSDIVNHDNTRTSQLRNAFYKIHSDIVLQTMSDYYSWEKFARHVWNNQEDDDVQLVLLNLNRFMGLDMQNLYESLMQMPFIVTDAQSKGTPSWTLVAAQNTQTPSDAANLFESLTSLGRDLSYPDFLDPVREAIQNSMASSLKAVQYSVAAWCQLHEHATASGVLTSDDGKRKFKELDVLMRQEILCTAFGFLGTNGVADFRFVEQLLLQQVSPGDITDIPDFLVRLKTTHGHLQKHFLQELICSENVWARTIKKITQLQMKESTQNSEYA